MKLASFLDRLCPMLEVDAAKADYLAQLTNLVSQLNWNRQHQKYHISFAYLASAFNVDKTEF